MGGGERLWAELSGFVLGTNVGPWWNISRVIPLAHMGVGNEGRRGGPGCNEWTSRGWACKVIKCSLPTLQMGKWWNREGTWSSLKVIWDVSAPPGRLTVFVFQLGSIYSFTFNHSFNHSFLSSFIHSVLHPFLHWLSPLFLSMSWPPGLTHIIPFPLALICASIYPFICPYSSFIQSYIHLSIPPFVNHLINPLTCLFTYLIPISFPIHLSMQRIKKQCSQWLAQGLVETSVQWMFIKWLVVIIWISLSTIGEHVSIPETLPDDAHVLFQITTDSPLRHITEFNLTESLYD